MRGVVGRLAAWLFVVLAALVVAVAAQAQPPPPHIPTSDLPTVASGQLGQPQNAVADTGLKLFDAALANAMADAIARMKKAFAECKVNDYARALGDWIHGMYEAGRTADATGPGFSQDTTTRGRANADNIALYNYLNSSQLPQYHRNCAPPAPPRQPVVGDPLPTMESGELSIPESPIRGTPIAVFNPQFASDVADALERMRKAVDDCDLARIASHGGA